MKLPNCLPRLSRKQRTARNFLAVILLVFLVWMVNDFSAPTARAALRWKAETYGLPEPEVLYRTEWDDYQRMAVFQAGNFIGTTMEYRGGGYSTSDFHLREIEEPVTLLWEEDRYIHAPLRGAEAVLARVNLPEASRAVCRLYLWEPVDVNNVRNTWEETYTMEASPNEHGIYRFAIQRKMADSDESLRIRQEELALCSFQNLGDRVVEPDLRCSVAITFYDERGEVVDTYENILAEGRKTE